MQTRIAVVLISVALQLSSSAGAQQSRDSESSLFTTSDHCIACHSNLHSASGADVSIGYAWRASMMANSARDPYWHAAVRREVMDHPTAQAAIEDKCSTCHMPMHRFAAVQAGESGQVFANVAALGTAPFALASDGVSCTVCHQIQGDNFGERESFEGGFHIDTASAPERRAIYARHEIDAGRQRVMRSAAGFEPQQSTHLQQAELCATCHTLYTTALDAAGNQIGELPEQMPYREWLHSEYRNTQSCQACHMPELADETPISSVLGQPRPAFSQHTFRGANAFMLGLLNKYRDALGVQALPQELEAGIQRAREHLGTSAARLAIAAAAVSNGGLEIEVEVENLAGHKLPTAYPSRRVWLHVSVRDAAGRVIFESGAFGSDGSIAGNDNDADGTRYEPHYDLIERADQVQIYEPILADAQGRVTTGLLTAVRYAKDNRLLPRGFAKLTADADVAVNGGALDDDDFAAGMDRVSYRIALPGGSGNLTVDVELLYQTIGFRWAENLKQYAAPEPERFVGYYRDSVKDSAERLAAARAVVSY